MGALVGRFVLAAALVGADGTAKSVRRHSARALQAAALLIVPAFALIFARQLVEFRDPFVPISEDVELLLGTDWGAAWRWGSGAAVVACLAGLASGRLAAGWFIAGVALLLTGVYPAFTGHAAGADPRSLSIALDVLHVWAASAWIGGLALLVAGLRSSDSGAHISPLVNAFSPVALFSVAALVASGVWANLQHLGGPANLVGTAWGRILLVKLLLVTAVLALGFRNWRRLTPRLGEPEANSALRSSATLELVLGHLALIATAVLIRTSPG